MQAVFRVFSPATRHSQTKRLEVGLTVSSAQPGTSINRWNRFGEASWPIQKLVLSAPIFCGAGAARAFSSGVGCAQWPPCMSGEAFFTRVDASVRGQVNHVSCGNSVGLRKVVPDHVSIQSNSLIRATATQRAAGEIFLSPRRYQNPIFSKNGRSSSGPKSASTRLPIASVGASV